MSPSAPRARNATHNRFTNSLSLFGSSSSYLNLVFCARIFLNKTKARHGRLPFLSKVRPRRRRKKRAPPCPGTYYCTCQEEGPSAGRFRPPGWLAAMDAPSQTAGAGICRTHRCNASSSAFDWHASNHVACFGSVFFRCSPVSRARSRSAPLVDSRGATRLYGTSKVHIQLARGRADAYNGNLGRG